jgi:hypothetical protein
MAAMSQLEFKSQISVVVVAFQIAFHAEIYVNDVFFIF